MTNINLERQVIPTAARPSAEHHAGVQRRQGYTNVQPHIAGVATSRRQMISQEILAEYRRLQDHCQEIEAARAEFGTQKNVSVSVIQGADQDFRDLAVDELAKKLKEFANHKLQG